MLVEEREIDEISVTDLATAAGVTRMTFYQYFPDKGTLLRAAGGRAYWGSPHPVRR